MKKRDEEKQGTQGLSRRTFLKNAAAGTGLAAAASSGLLAFNPEGEVPVEQDSDFGPDTPPKPIPPDQIKSTISVDVVVVGAGTAGVHAAWAAAKAGAKVALIEKTSAVQARGGDNTALNSKLHKQLGIQIDEQKVIDALMARGAGRLDQGLLNLWAHNSGRIMDMIIDQCAADGLPTYLVMPDRGDDDCAIIDKWPIPSGFPSDWNYLNERCIEFPTCHRPGGRAESQKKFLVSIAKAAKAKGATIHYDTKAMQLERKENGPVTAVIAQAKDKSYIKFEAKKGVILCTGDYGANKEMMAKYCPQMPLPCWVTTSTGDGHMMGLWVGGVMENAPHAPMSHMFHIMGTDAFLMVNSQGKRVFNEDSDTESMANQAYEQGGIWVIFDASWEEDVPHMGPGFKRVFRATDRVRKELADAVAGGGWRKVLQASTIEELAGKMKVPVDTFKATVERYNELAKAKKDLDFGKRPDRLTAVDRAPYYAEWTAKPAFSLVVMGGLLANERLQALDKNNKPIPGLYLAGNTVGRRFKDGYPLICPGISHSMAYTHGYLAGEFASSAK